jgi:hypothetical protein
MKRRCRNTSIDGSEVARQVPVSHAVYAPAGDPRRDKLERGAPGPCPPALEQRCAAADSRSWRSTAKLGWHQCVQDRPDFCLRRHRTGAKLGVSVPGTRTCTEQSHTRGQRCATSEARSNRKNEISRGEISRVGSAEATRRVTVTHQRSDPRRPAKRSKNYPRHSQSVRSGDRRQGR